MKLGGGPRYVPGARPAQFGEDGDLQTHNARTIALRVLHNELPGVSESFWLDVFPSFLELLHATVTGEERDVSPE